MSLFRSHNGRSRAADMLDARPAVLEAGAAAHHLPALRQHHSLDHGHLHDDAQLDHAGDSAQVQIGFNAKIQLIY